MTSTEKARKLAASWFADACRASAFAGLWSARRTSWASPDGYATIADGSVEVLAMGTRDQLFGLRSRLRAGPRAARVDDVEEFEAKPVAGLKTFRIEGAW